MNGYRDESHCLVLTSTAPEGTEIRQHTDGLIEYVVREPVEGAGYQVLRMDEMTTPGVLSDAVLRELYSAGLVIADLSFADPAVMYALGVRHSFGLPVIHLHTPSSIFPFDVQGLTGVVFDLGDLAEIKRARKRLAERLREIEPSDQMSPVQATVRLDDLRRDKGGPQASANDVTVANGLRAIEQRLEVMERRFTSSMQTRELSVVTPPRPRRVFIVHGHDGELKHQLARLLQSLDFDPVILQELPDSGRTLIEKLRAETAEIGFVFVLITPDDIGRSKVDEQGELAERARQNVVFEHGLFSALLEPERVCAIQRGEVEMPSDLYGLVRKRIPDGSGIEAISLDIVRELQRAGFDVDANLLMEG